MAAQTFLNKHELPASYLDQVVDFIHKSTNGATLGQETGGSTYVDPYTGSSRYTGSTSSSTQQGGSDPFTGTSHVTAKGVKLVLMLRWISIHEFWLYSCPSTR
jgi:phospholipase A-2-activating protein